MHPLASESRSPTLQPGFPLITLLTDFGVADPYVAMMKAAILAEAPAAEILDISHAVAPQNIDQAAFLIAASVPFFPRGAIHLVVVDPGVGGDRRMLAAECAGSFFVAPDNGVLTELFHAHPPNRIVQIPPPPAESVSATFHGRDIFAPAAARLAAGTPLDRIGPEIDAPVLLPRPTPRPESDGTVRGRIRHIDHFGNAVTDIPAAMIPQTRRGNWALVTPEGAAFPLAKTYSARPPGSPLAVVGGLGFLEAAINSGNAAAAHGLRLGGPILLAPLPERRRGSPARPLSAG